MKFSPAADYENLLRQAYSLAGLVNAQESELTYFRSKDYATSEAKLSALQSGLDSERAMNARLTEELEMLSKAIPTNIPTLCRDKLPTP